MYISAAFEEGGKKKASPEGDAIQFQIRKLVSFPNAGSTTVSSNTL